jgi:hypothetical protein
MRTRFGDVDGDPLSNLAEAVKESAVAVAVYRELMEGEDFLEVVDYGHAGGVRREPNPYVKLWNEERDRKAKLCKLALDAGLVQRQLNILEAEGQRMTEVWFWLIDQLGLVGEERDRARRLLAGKLRVISAQAAS